MSFADYLAQLAGLNDPVTYAIPIFIALILWEAILDSKEKLEIYHQKEAWASIAMGAGSVVINLFTKFVYFIAFNYIYENIAIWQLGFEWWVWVLAFFADDFSFYWHHRLSHQIRILWAAHSNHHSSQDYNLAIALRQSWTEGFYKFLFYAWMPFIGIPPVMVFTMTSISLIYQFFLHTQMVKKLGFLEYFMNTPSHHRVHHGVNLKYLDKNHGGVLIIWDKLFGTFEPEQEKVVYGLTKNIQTHNPLLIATAEFKNIYKDLKKAPKFSDKLKYLFFPPGWSHDGTSKTTKEMQKNIS
ncbi:MAG: sterol desaturase family protein [Raineya sp.]|nr:sterol desaturase family protein [Raineya sp.]MDW8296267.1 sterol desaturase family protein [Raineya sp.]